MTGQVHLTASNAGGKIYRYDDNAFFSIDGERYPAQRI